MRIFFPSSHGASRRAGGTQVVLPLPGGARRTTSRFAANDAAMAGITFSTGKLFSDITSRSLSQFQFQNIFNYIIFRFIQSLENAK
jgi:hypothetical protein